MLTDRHLRSSRSAFGLTVLMALLGTSAAQGAEQPVTSAEWPLIGGNEYEQHYSNLKQINSETASHLKLKWYSDLPTRDGLTGVPIVVGDAVYDSGALGKAWAHDVRTGKQLWEFDAAIKFPMPVIPSWGARASRGLAVWKDTVLKATGDCRLFALDRRTGKKLWETQPCDVPEYKTITGAPRVGDGKVFIGNSNADSGIGRGHVDAYDIATGKRLWRFYTIPGDPAKGFENHAMEMASKTWGREYWKKAGGGSPWDGITYDPRTHLVLIGVDAPSPGEPTMRGEGAGDELFTNALVAVNADTGEYVWHYSTTPGDAWNYAASFPVVLADLTLDGQKTPVVMLAPKNGFFYVFDAKTGRLLNQPKPIVELNWASAIDMRTGRPIRRPDATYWTQGERGALVSPAPMGARNWMPMSFSPLTGLVYIPVTDYPMRMFSDPSSLVGHVDVDYYWGLDHGERFEGRLLAWDPVHQERRWEVKTGKPYEGGTLVTAGNLVFQGHTDGTFNAYDATSGKKLWSFDTGGAILAAPSTVEIDGEQLVIVPTGSATTSAIGFARRLAGDATMAPPRLLAFSLRGDVRLAVNHRTSDPFETPPAPRPDPSLARAGKLIWDAAGCELCHGTKAIGGIGSVPDLRRITDARLSLFPQIVRGGLLKASGMPVFEESIREEDLPALKAYILGEAWRVFDAQNKSDGK